MKLIVISSSGKVENEANLVTQLFEAGLETFHLRKLKWTTKQMKDFLMQIPEHFHKRIVIHSHHNLARKFNLGGIHLTSNHKKKKWKTWFTIKLVQLKHPKIEVTTSFKNIGQLLDEHSDFNYSYVFLSPVFDNHASRFQSGFTEHGLHSTISKTKYAVIARGGVDINAIEKAHKIGFKGLAFYSAIWRSKDPVAEFNKVVEKFEELKIPIS